MFSSELQSFPWDDMAGIEEGSTPVKVPDEVAEGSAADVGGPRISRLSRACMGRVFNHSNGSEVSKVESASPPNGSESMTKTGSCSPYFPKKKRLELYCHYEHEEASQSKKWDVL